MKKTVSAHVYNTIERYPQILKTPKVEKAMGNLKCWMALRVNRGFDNSSYGSRGDCQFDDRSKANLCDADCCHCLCVRIGHTSIAHLMVQVPVYFPTA